MSNMAKMRAWLKGALALVFLMGITWLFGLLNTGDKGTEVFAALFVILSGGQGVFIYAFHCRCNDKVKKEYRRVLRRADWLPDEIRLCCLKLFSSSSAHDMIQTSTSPSRKVTVTETTANTAASYANETKRDSGFRSTFVEIPTFTAAQLADAGVYMGEEVDKVRGAAASVADRSKVDKKDADEKSPEVLVHHVPELPEMEAGEEGEEKEEKEKGTPTPEIPAGDL